MEWLYDYGSFDQRPQDLDDPSVTSAAQPRLAPGGRSASLQQLARSGAIVTGRLIAVHENELRFDDSAAANAAFADRYAADVRSMLDRRIPPSGRTVPVEPDEADAPVRLDPPITLHLRREVFGVVAWATGYVGDFSWLPADLLDTDGAPGASGRRESRPDSRTSDRAGSPAEAPATSSASQPTPRRWPPPSTHLSRERALRLTLSRTEHQ